MAGFVDARPKRYRLPFVTRLAFTNLRVGIAALFLSCAPCAPAQSPPPPAAPPPPSAQPPRPQPAKPESFDGRPIRELRLRRLDPADPTKTLPIEPSLEQLIRNQARSVAGTPFSHVTATEDVTRLNRLGNFRSIASDVQLQDDGSVAVIFTFTQQPLIQDIQVVGNRDLSDQEILKETSIIALTPIDRFQIDRNARAIEDLYRTKGYYRCRVTVDEKELADSGIVLYHIIEGERVKVSSIRFEGNLAFSAKELRSPITTTEYVPVFDKGPLDDDVLNADVIALQKFYRERGYLDTRTSWKVQPSPDGKEAIVTFGIEEGPLYNLRSIHVVYGGISGIVGSDTDKAVSQYRDEVLHNPRADVEYLTADQMRQVGRRPFSDAQIAGLMSIKPGDVYSEDKLRKSQDAIKAAYGKLGTVVYIGGKPESVALKINEVRDEKLPQVDILLFISEGKPYRVGEVIVTGDDLTKQKVILRQVQIKPGRPLDSELMAQSQKDIESMRLFEPGSVKIAIQPEDPERPGERDIDIEVAETNTGQVNFGVAVGSDAGVVGQVGIKQTNFDVAAVPHSFDELFSGQAFRGAGQTFDLEILPGNLTQLYSLSLIEPYLFETNYSGSATAFFSLHDLDGYTERRYGTRVGVGRRFGTLWTGNLQARVESVDLYDIDPSQPVDVFEVENPHTVTGLGFTLTRNTTNDRFRPSRGSHITLAAEQVGALGGDFSFTNLRSDYSTFFALHESFLGYKTILKLSNTIGYIPQSSDDVPTYERLYLGGNSFRGFRYRTISPKGIRHDTLTQGEDPVGGTFLFFAGAEVNQPIYKDIVSIVTFLDTGTVQDTVGFDQYRASIGFGFRLSLSQLSPVPLAFDFGVPILSQPGDKRRLFSFSIDLPYQ